jgi:hypothetical protein
MPRTGAQNTAIIMEDTSWERMWSGEVHGLLRIARPWVALGLLCGAGWLAHRLWGRMPAVPWAAIALIMSATGLAAFTWAMSKLVIQGRTHSTATVAAAGLWLTIATITGPFTGVTGGSVAIFGAAAALSWNIRGHARHRAASAGTDSAGNRLSAWFADATREAGVSGATLQIKAIEPTRVQGTALLPPGERTAADLQSKVRHVESGMKFPPGSLSIAEDPDRADHALVTVSDPRLIRNPIPHPGPSLPGASIALPLRPGIWQDGMPIAHVLPGHHLHVMGATGSGKSEGGCWGYSAEIITRYDVAELAADITKRNQTWGPLEPALHRYEYSRDGVRDMLNGLHKLLPQRTEFLADHGLTKWTEGCGLTYLVIWLEETPDIYDALKSSEQEHWQSDVKAFRSAGGSFVVSLQRSDWTQIPTLVRGQMASVCFGLYKSSDERFGLSEKQLEMGASPAALGTDHPGTGYLHYPGTPPERIAMQMRTFAWGDLTSKETHDVTAASAMAAYAAQYPAAARPVDPLTAALTGTPASTVTASATPAGPHFTRPVTVLTRPRPDDEDHDQDQDPETDDYDDDEEETDVYTEYLKTEDPTPELTASIDDPIEPGPDDQPFEFDTEDPIDPATARQIFTDHLAQLRADGKTVLAAKDFRPIIRPGMGRAWIHDRLNEAVERGDLVHDRDEATYQFPQAA